MQVIESKALRMSVPPTVASDIIEMIPKSQRLGDDDVLVYWGQREAEILSSLLDLQRPSNTIEIPSPMLRDYAWPGIYTPFYHQKETASFLSLRYRAFCFSEMGTGKTSACIWAADYLMKLGLVKRVLVVCPLSIMYSAWRDDIFKTAMHRSCGIAHGDKAKRQKIINSSYEFVVINYDGISVVYDDLARADFDLIIVDEANAYKSTSTKRWRTMAKLVKSNTRLWMLTGTPACQSPEDAFGLARLISPSRVPRFMTAWRDMVMTQISRFKWVPKLDSKQKVFKALQPAIRYTKAECLDLPSVTYQVREIPLTVQVHRYYKELKKQLLVEAAGQEISAVNAAAALNKLLQISGGAVYTDKHDVVEFDVSPRLEELKEILDQTYQKVLVYVPYLHTIETVTRYLTEQGITSEVIKGSVNASERSHIIARFQTAPDPRVLVIQPHSASHGVTLTAADTVVFWSPVMSVETFLQCVGRVDRVGQVNKVTVVMLQGSEIERKVYAMLRGKVDAHKSLTELYKSELTEE